MFTGINKLRGYVRLLHGNHANIDATQLAVLVYQSVVRYKPYLVMAMVVVYARIKKFCLPCMRQQADHKES